MDKQRSKEFVMNILNGIAIGIVIVLVPGAIMGELSKSLAPTIPFFALMSQATTMANSMLGFAVGVLVGWYFKMTPIQAVSIGLATIFAGGAITATPEGALVLKGTGDVVNMGLTAVLAVLLVRLLGERLKAYAVLVIPVVVLCVAGGIGRLILPYSLQVTGVIGQGVAQLLQLQPILMSASIGMAFAVLIVSPITSVGVALAISISGIGAGAANLGICACGFGLAVAGWRVNSKGTCIAHFIGSPKLSMANFLSKPKILLPIACSAAVCALSAVVFQIHGTPLSAGFGFSGLVGPVSYLNSVAGGWSLGNIAIAVFAFALLPIISGIFFNYLFTKVLGIVKPEDYKINI